MSEGDRDLTKRVGLFAEDGLEDAHERLGELIFQVILGVDRDIILEDVERVFGFLVRAGVLGPLDDYV